MAALHNNLVGGSLAAIRRRELTLLQAAFGEHVVTLLEGERKLGKLVIKGEPVPICASLNLLILARKAIALAQTNVRHFIS